MIRVVSRALVGLLAATLLLHAQPAFAPFHLTVIEQVFFGTENCPNAQFVVLRTQDSGQIFVQNQTIAVQNADGSDAGLFGTFTRNLTDNPGEGVAILMATAEAEGLFGITADEVASGQLVFPDGRVCFGEFDGPVDCVAFGNFTGNNTGFGSPAVQPQLGMALVRQSETGDNSADFVLGTPAPENNAGQVGVLGECPAETATPTATPSPPVSQCTGDCNGDGQVVVNELVLGVSIGLGSAGVEQCRAMDRNDDQAVTVDELVTAVGHALEGCPAPPTATPTQTPLPTFDAPLGTRRFSLNPETSSFRIAGLPIPLQSTGFQGFLDIEAGQPDPETGLTTVDVTDASEFLSILLQPPIGPAIAVCLEPVREMLPIRNAGFLSCFGGFDLGFALTQDHNIGVVGVDGFTEEDCLAAGGIVEPPGGPHPGVCNGPIVPGQPGGDSGAGALVIAPDPETLQGGLPVILTMEDALPCGDEGAVGEVVPLALTSATAIATILDRNNIAGNVLEVSERGQNFSCTEWTEENGPGTLVLGAPLLDLDTGVIGFVDIINVFRLDD